MKRNLLIIIVLFVMGFFFFSCKGIDEPFTIDNMKFSSDTIVFDTVFTTIGSSTRVLKVYNTSNEDITISKIALFGGKSSPYSLNVDGRAGDEFTDININRGDSIFVFTKVRIDPNNANNPLVVEDSIMFSTEKGIKMINLIAWGQDANYIVADKFPNNLPPYKIVAAEGENIIWDSPKPYVVYGYAVVDSTANLVIKPGVKVHFHSNGGLWVYKGGSIQVLGTPDNKVVFQGDRLEPSYKDVPGQWEKIWLNEGSINNEFRNVEIKNGFIGLQAETLQEPMGNFLILENVEIKNMTGMGIYSRRYGIIAGNCVVSNCGGYLTALTQGGYYDFRHCTFANFWHKSLRENPSVFISNYFVNPFDESIYISDLEHAYLGNCIVYGDRDNEIQIDDTQPSTIFNCNIDNSLIQYKDIVNLNTSYFSDCIYNKSPLFTDSVNYNFHIDTIVSPVINAGKMSVITESHQVINISNDFDGLSRVLDGKPDLGAYEFNK